MTVNDNNIQAEGLGRFFKNSVKFSAKAGKKQATNDFKNSGRASNTGTKTGSAAVMRTSKPAFSTLVHFINSYRTGKRLYLGIFSR